MMQKRYAGYVLQEQLLSQRESVEYWLASGNLGVAEVYILPKDQRSLLLGIPTWNAFADFHILEEEHHIIVVIPGMLQRPLQEISKIETVGTSCCIAWHISAVFGELHSSGGAHGFIHPAHIGLDDKGELSIRPALAAFIPSDPDELATALATDCWQLSFVLNVLGVSPKIDPRFSLLMSGLQQDVSRLRLQPASAIRQSLTAVMARHPEWEEEAKSTLGKKWGLDHLPVVEERVVPHRLDRQRNIKKERRSSLDEVDLWSSPFTSTIEVQEERSSGQAMIREAFRNSDSPKGIELPLVEDFFIEEDVEPIIPARIQLPTLQEVEPVQINISDSEELLEQESTIGFPLNSITEEEDFTEEPRLRVQLNDNTSVSSNPLHSEDFKEEREEPLEPSIPDGLLEISEDVVDEITSKITASIAPKSVLEVSPSNTQQEYTAEDELEEATQLEAPPDQVSSIIEPSIERDDVVTESESVEQSTSLLNDSAVDSEAEVRAFSEALLREEGMVLEVLEQVALDSKNRTELLSNADKISEVEPHIEVEQEPLQELSVVLEKEPSDGLVVDATMEESRLVEETPQREDSLSKEDSVGGNEVLQIEETLAKEETLEIEQSVVEDVPTIEAALLTEQSVQEEPPHRDDPLENNDYSVDVPDQYIVPEAVSQEAVSQIEEPLEKDSLDRVIIELQKPETEQEVAELILEVPELLPFEEELEETVSLSKDDVLSTPEDSKESGYIQLEPVGGFIADLPEDTVADVPENPLDVQEPLANIRLPSIEEVRADQDEELGEIDQLFGDSGSLLELSSTSDEEPKWAGAVGVSVEYDDENALGDEKYAEAVNPFQEGDVNAAIGGSVREIDFEEKGSPWGLVLIVAVVVVFAILYTLDPTSSVEEIPETKETQEEGMGGIAMENNVEFSTNPPGGLVYIDNEGKGIEPILLTLDSEQSIYRICIDWGMNPICRNVPQQDLAKGSYTFSKDP